MNSLYNFLNQEQTEFAAKLGEKGGYIQFTNSGRRGTPKSFHISLESLYKTLLDIKGDIIILTIFFVVLITLNIIGLKRYRKV